MACWPPAAACLTQRRSDMHARRANASRANGLDVVAPERGVGGENGQLLELRLRHEQAVERIAVMPRQRRDVQGVTRQHRERSDRRAHHESRNVRCRRLRQRQLAERELDRNLPRAGRRQHQLVVGRDDNRAALFREPLGCRHHPEPDVRVEQNSHDSKASRSSGGSGASKSSPIVMRPRSEPSTRSPSGSVTGTRRATGTPARAMYTSCPSATRFRSLDNWVLASCTLYVRRLGMATIWLRTWTKARAAAGRAAL